MQPLLLLGLIASDVLWLLLRCWSRQQGFVLPDAAAAESERKMTEGQRTVAQQ